MAYIRSLSWLRAASLLACVFWGGALACMLLLRSLPVIEGVEREAIKLPRTFEQLHELHEALDAYQRSHAVEVAGVLLVCYVFLQAFMIPGALFLNILAGSLYPYHAALPVIVVVSAMGSSLCYFLSSFLLRDIMHGLFPERCSALSAEVLKHRQHLTNYMIFLRVTPILPNWFVNASSPVVSIPFDSYIVGTVIGILPINALSVKAGQTLGDITSVKDLYSPGMIGVMLGLAVIALVPVAWTYFNNRDARRVTKLRRD